MGMGVVVVMATAVPNLPTLLNRVILKDIGNLSVFYFKGRVDWL
jgi:hypothetical protein